MANTIQHKRSSTSGVAPAASGLSQGELAINIADGKLYTKNSSNAVINLGVTSISGTYITPSSGNFFNYLAVNGIPVSISGHSHESVPQAESLVTTVFNETGSSIAKMTAVYINGGHGDRPTIQKAIATGDATSAGTYGLTYETIGINQEGRVIVFGALSGVNTDQFNPSAPQGDVNGTVVYLSPTVSGGLTTTKPYAPNHIVALGVITRTHQNEGIIEVRVQNGFELEELHNVAISGVTDGQFLNYNASNSLWVATSSGNFTTLNIGDWSIQQDTISHINNIGSIDTYLSKSAFVACDTLLGKDDYDYGITSSITIGDYTKLNHINWNIDEYGIGSFSNVKVNSNDVWHSGSLPNPVNGTGLANHIAYWSSSSGIVADSGQLVWDSTNNRLGIGTSSPQELIHISGSIASSTGNLLRLNNSSATTNPSINFRIGGVGNYDSHFFISRNGTDVFGIDTNNRGLFLNSFSLFGNQAFLSYNNANAFIKLQNTTTNDLEISAVSGILFQSSQSTKMTMDKDGKFGIGTTTPASNFHIAAASNNDYGNILVSGTNVSTHVGLGGLSDTVPFLASLSAGTIATSVYGFGMFYRNTEGDFTLSRKSGSTSWIRCLNIQRSNGYVGIGSGTQAIAPPEMLTVDGHIRLADKASVGNKLQFYRGGGTANDYTIGTQGNHLAISTAPDSTTQRYTEFGYHSAGTWTPKTRLNNYTGALGVNLTATPSGSLDVGGDIYVRGAGTTGVMYFKSGSLADTTCRVRTDTNGNIYLEGGGANVRCGSQDGRADMYASSQWITIGNTYDAGTANQYVRFVPANTEMMRVTKTGVGFGGVTSPLDRIHVSGTQTTIRLNNGLGYDTQLRMIDTVSDWSVGINQGNSAGSGVFSIRSVTAGSHRLIINPSGDIGIGTISPTAKLDVRGSAVFNEDGANVDFRVEGDTDTNLLFVDASADKVGIGTNSPTQKLHIAGNLLVEDSGPYSVISATESEGFTIYGDGGFSNAGILFTDRANGRIGIGTNAPNANLAISAGGAGGTINGAVQSQPFQINDATTSDYINLAHFNITNSSSRGSFTLSNNSSGAWENNVMQFFIHGDTYAHGYYGGNTNDAGCAMIVTQGSQISKLQIGNYGSAPIEFFTDNNFRAIIDSAGNVGIGTSSPSTKLQVDGFISQSANHITVGLTSDQTIPTGVDTVVQMTDKDDPNNWWDATTYRFSPTVAGYYYISAQVNWKSDSGTGQINSQLRRNGTTFCLTMTPQINSTGNTITHSLNGIVNMNGSTDYVDLTAYTSASDGSQLISGTADQAWTKLEAFKIS